MGDPLAYIVYLIGAVALCIIFLIEALPGMICSLIESIGLARICNKLGAFPRAWSWVLSILLPAVAVIRAGDMAALREDANKKSLLKQGIVGLVLFAVCILLGVLCTVIAFATAVLDWPAIYAKLTGVAVLILCAVALILFIWLFVLLFISHFRIFKAYVPAWGAWLLLAGSILLGPLSFAVLPVLSFFPFKKIPEEPIREL
ncbi:MAG: hypothetical protein E7581_04610 [Ruminococcaceae bacterium]|nr:hypothetical protein [Oscillospiraceae bacterium]